MLPAHLGAGWKAKAPEAWTNVLNDFDFARSGMAPNGLPHSASRNQQSLALAIGSDVIRNLLPGKLF